MIAYVVFFYFQWHWTPAEYVKLSTDQQFDYFECGRETSTGEISPLTSKATFAPMRHYAEWIKTSIVYIYIPSVIS